MDMYFVLQGIFLVAKIRELGRRGVEQSGMLEVLKWWLGFPDFFFFFFGGGGKLIFTLLKFHEFFNLNSKV
jgi:hypothetical protein